MALICMLPIEVFVLKDKMKQSGNCSLWEETFNYFATGDSRISLVVEYVFQKSQMDIYIIPCSN